MAIDEVVVRKRLQATFRAVADQTTVADHPGEAERPELYPPTDISRRAWRRPAVLVATAACLVLLVVAVVFGGGGDQSLDTLGDLPSPTTSPPNSGSSLSGVEAYVIPPLVIDGVPLTAVQTSESLVTEGDDPGERWSPVDTAIGRWRVKWERTGNTRDVTYRYSTDQQIQGAPDVWIGMSAPARFEFDEVSDGSGRPAKRVEGSDELVFADLGVVCPDDGTILGVTQGWPSSSCQRRAIGGGRDFVVELVLPVEIDLDAIVAELQVGTFDELSDAIGPVEGLDHLGAPPIELPIEEPVPPPDTPFCNAWLGVLELARAGTSPYATGMIDAMGVAAEVAPPGLATQIRDLAALWSATPPGAPPNQDSAVVMMNIVNAASAECPGIQDWIAGE